MNSTKACLASEWIEQRAFLIERERINSSRVYLRQLLFWGSGLILCIAVLNGFFLHYQSRPAIQHDWLSTLKFMLIFWSIFGTLMLSTSKAFHSAIRFYRARHRQDGFGQAVLHAYKEIPYVLYLRNFNPETISNQAFDGLRTASRPTAEEQMCKKFHPHPVFKLSNSESIRSDSAIPIFCTIDTWPEDFRLFATYANVIVLDVRNATDGIVEEIVWLAEHAKDRVIYVPPLRDEDFLPRRAIAAFKYKAHRFVAPLETNRHLLSIPDVPQITAIDTSRRSHISRQDLSMAELVAAVSALRAREIPQQATSFDEKLPS